MLLVFDSSRIGLRGGRIQCQTVSMSRKIDLIRFVGIAATLISSGAAHAQDRDENDWRATYNLYGTTGLIDLPSALAAPNSELATTVSVFGGNQRGTLTFQVLPRLSGSFRYSFLDTYDRSFDLQYLIADEGPVRPAVSVGLRDFLGTGRFSSEYIVATKTILPNVRVTGGLGWGRLGGVGGFSNPLGFVDERLETRPDDAVETGGTVLAAQFFRGDAALFGGVEWRLNDHWTALAEYSSDAYEREEELTGFERNSPLNFGLKWQPNDTFAFGGYYVYGSEIGVSATIQLDPLTRENAGGLDGAPFPVVTRANAVAAASWATPEASQATVDVLGQALAIDGFRLVGAEVTGSTLRVRYENQRYRSEAQGAGRVSRILTALASPDVDTFVLEPEQSGIALSAITIQRDDLENLENEPNAAALSLDRAQFGDAAGPAPVLAYEDSSPAFQWGIAPYTEFTVFDGDNPLRADAGIEASFRYEFRPNIILQGAYRQRLVGNRDNESSISPSALPDVRRTSQLLGADSGNGIENLFLTWYGRPKTDLYSRVSAGYLERGFAGVSTEVLWKPVESPLAIGAELNYAMLREFDLGFGFRPACTNLECTILADENYDVVTGYISAYYDFGFGFAGEINAGRFLAGDVGARFSLDRVFTNGWKVGGFFTLTDVSFDDFGEGSFDKGIRIEIPLDAFAGQPTRDTGGTTLTSLARDGGARLDIDGRLYEVIEDGHGRSLAQTWGRFWR